MSLNTFALGCGYLQGVARKFVEVSILAKPSVHPGSNQEYPEDRD